MDTDATHEEHGPSTRVPWPELGDVVLYVTHKPVAGGGAELTRIPALVTAVNADGTLELTAFHPGADPVVFHEVRPSIDSSYGGWEPRAPRSGLTFLA